MCAMRSSPDAMTRHFYLSHSMYLGSNDTAVFYSSTCGSYMLGVLYTEPLIDMFD